MAKDRDARYARAADLAAEDGGQAGARDRQEAIGVQRQPIDGFAVEAAARQERLVNAVTGVESGCGAVFFFTPCCQST